MFFEARSSAILGPPSEMRAQQCGYSEDGDDNVRLRHEGSLFTGESDQDACGTNLGIALVSYLIAMLLILIF